jgi:hypothetical protein
MSKLFKYYKPLLLLFSFLIVSNYCQAEITAMSNNELEEVTGTGTDTAFSSSITPTGTMDFTFEAQTKDGTPVSGSGTLDVVEKTEIIDTATLSLNDSAQENLQALVNVNSVNSAIQVLLNLNVNINSIVESLDQTNQAQLN